MRRILCIVFLMMGIYISPKAQTIVSSDLSVKEKAHILRIAFHAGGTYRLGNFGK